MLTEGAPLSSTVMWSTRAEILSVRSSVTTPVRCVVRRGLGVSYWEAPAVIV
jgi:hypothetical protein